MTESAMEKLKKREGNFGVVFSALCFLLLTARCSSPLYMYFYNGYDSSFFTMMGRAILSGKVMYRDYHDIKGPLFFFWQALGQSIFTGRGGLFVLEAVCIVAAAFLIRAICRLYGLGSRKTVLTMAVFYFMYAAVIWDGNTVEEFVLPLNLACIYLGLKYLKGRSLVYPVALVSGLTFGVCLFSKLTACAPMCAVALVIFISLLRKREFALIVRSALLFLLPVILVGGPILIYYHSVGALDDMLLWCFRMAYTRGLDDTYLTSASVEILLWIQMLSPGLFGLVWFFMTRGEERQDRGLILALSLICVPAILLGSHLPYYLITLLPLMVVTTAAFLSSVGTVWDAPVDRGRLISVLVMTFGLILVCITYLDRNITNADNDMKSFINATGVQLYGASKELVKTIPPEERGDVICMDYGQRFFEINRMLPANRDVLNAMYFSEVIPSLREDMLEEIREGRHKWIYMEMGDKYNLEEDVENAINSAYEMEDDYGRQLILWKRKEPGHETAAD